MSVEETPSFGDITVLSVSFLLNSFPWLQKDSVEFNLSAQPIFSCVMCRTPLHAAAYSGSVPGLQLVLAQGAEVNAVDHFGCSALMVAADCGQTNAVGM